MMYIFSKEKNPYSLLAIWKHFALISMIWYITEVSDSSRLKMGFYDWLSHGGHNLIAEAQRKEQK